MTLKIGHLWEKRHPKASKIERGIYYFNTHAAAWDLLGNIDAWEIHSSKTSKTNSVKELIVNYYESLEVGGLRASITARKTAIETYATLYPEVIARSRRLQ